MRSVNLKKEELLKIVIENRNQHIAQYEESVTDYKTAIIKIAKENLKLVSSGDLEKISKFRTLPPTPVSHVSEYDRAIRMLELSVDNEINLDREVFDQLVLDEWQWKKAFTLTNTMYKTLV